MFKLSKAYPTLDGNVMPSLLPLPSTYVQEIGDRQLFKIVEGAGVK